MKQPQTRALFDYWNRLRGARTMPERCDIDPAAIRHVLTDTFVLEVDASRSFPMRLAGGRLQALFMHPLKGSGFLDLWPHPADAREILHLMRTVCDDAVGIVAGVTGAPGEGRAIDLELLLLPLRHYGRTHARLIGCMTPAHLESWSGLAPMRLHALSSLRVLTQADMRERAPALPAAPPRTSRPRLRLLQGGLTNPAERAQPSPAL
jgi:hypothetical protein